MSPGAHTGPVLQRRSLLQQRHLVQSFTVGVVSGVHMNFIQVFNLSQIDGEKIETVGKWLCDSRYVRTRASS